MIPSLSLRGHDCPVTASCTVYSDTPSLHSGDDSGTLISWDLYRRRPQHKWLAHSSSIITIVSLSDSCILTHGKDESIKIWDSTSPLSSTQPIFSLPANTLNFCNVVVLAAPAPLDVGASPSLALMNHLHFLFTPAGASSNNIDVYTISSDRGFYRVIANLDPHALYNHASPDSMVIPEIGSEARDFGIIMRICASESGIVLGFESGHVLELTATNWLEESTVTLSYMSEAHCPNPVTSLALMGDTRVASASTSSKLLVHDLQLDTVLSLRIPRSGTHSINAFGPSNLAIAYWLGLLQVGTVKPDEFDVFDSGSRPLPHVSLTVSQITLIGNTATSTAKPRKMYLTLILHALNTGQGIVQSYKRQCNRRRIAALENLYFVGYDDGVIVAYKLNAP